VRLRLAAEAAFLIFRRAALRCLCVAMCGSRARLGPGTGVFGGDASQCVECAGSCSRATARPR
jgi:hypothetical protein